MCCITYKQTGSHVWHYSTDNITERKGKEDQFQLLRSITLMQLKILSDNSSFNLSQYMLNHFQRGYLANLHRQGPAKSAVGECGKWQTMNPIFIMKIKSNTANKDLPWRFGLYQRPSSEENGTNSSSGSCHGSDVMWQEICHTCGSVCSCHVTSLPWQEPEEESVSFSSDKGLW